MKLDLAKQHQHPPSLSPYLGVHEDEGQLGGDLSSHGPEVELDLHGVRDDHAEHVTGLGVGQPAREGEGRVNVGLERIRVI